MAGLLQKTTCFCHEGLYLAGRYSHMVDFIQVDYSLPEAFFRREG